MAIYRAKEAFSFQDKDGVPQTVNVGSLISDSSPEFKGREHLFEPVEDHVVAESARRRGKPVEDATAEPGARRSISTRGGEK